MVEKKDTFEEKMAPKKKSIAKFAALSTLSEEELAEANEGVDDEDEDVYGDDEDEESAVSENDDMVADEAEDEYIPPKEDDTPMEHFGDKVTLSAHPTKSDVTSFMFRHTYLSGIGIVSIVVAIASLVYMIICLIRQDIFPAVLAAVSFGLFAIYTPFNLVRSSRKNAETLNSPEGVITYTFSDAGLDITRGEEYAKYPWSRVIKVITGKTGYYVYLAKNRAFIVPKADLGENEEIFKGLLARNVVKKKAPEETIKMDTKD